MAKIGEIPRILFTADGKPKPRGSRASTDHGTLIENFGGDYLTTLIRDTGGIYGPIGVQYVVNPAIRYKEDTIGVREPLRETENEVVAGLVHNYRGGFDSDGIYHQGRALATFTNYCAANCSFCTRGDLVGQGPNFVANIEDGKTRALAEEKQLSIEQIDNLFRYFEEAPDLSEIIISGGDFMISDKELFNYVVGKVIALQNKTKINSRGEAVPVIDIVRIGTRAPLQNPRLITDERIEKLKGIRNLNVMLHINHPAELTEQSLAAIEKFKDIRGVSLYSQSVFLRGVNAVLKPEYNEKIAEQDLVYEVRQGEDGKQYNVAIEDRSIDEDATVQLLIDMFTKFKSAGINPYYLFQNDKVLWAILLTVPPPQGIRIWQRVAEKIISGLTGFAQYVFDDGNGKIPVAKSQNIVSSQAAGHYDYRDNFILW